MTLKTYKQDGKHIAVLSDGYTVRAFGDTVQQAVNNAFGHVSLDDLITELLTVTLAPITADYWLAQLSI